MIEISVMRGLEQTGRYNFEWSGRPLKISREVDADIRIGGLPLIRFRAMLSLGTNGYLVRELSKTKSLKVNQRPVEEYGPLRTGDVIEAGGWALHITRTCPPNQADGLAPIMVSDCQVVDPQPLPIEGLVRGPDSAELTDGVNFLRSALEKLQRNWTSMSDDEVRRECWAILRREESPLRESELVRHDLGSRIVSEVVGLGPLERYLSNPEVSEVMVNGVDAIFIERAGQIERVEGRFADELSLRRVIERIFTPTGRRIDDACPMADARLPDGSRVNAVLAPPAVKGASLTIRRFVRAQLQASDIVRGHGASEAMLDYLSECVRTRRSILVSGGTGSGKTTFLRYLASDIPTYERLITIEDAAELNLEHPNIVALEVRSNNQEGIGGISIRDLVRNALRMRPDRILIGEVRGGEALDLLQAMNTGHEGSLTTLHANSPRDALARLEVMAMMAGYEIPIIALREQIACAIDVIVQMSRDSDGRRFVSAISRVEGLDSGRIQLDPVFEWSKESQAFRAIGVMV